MNRITENLSNMSNVARPPLRDAPAARDHWPSCGRNRESGAPAILRLVALPLGLAAFAALAIGWLVLARPSLIGAGSMACLAATAALAWFWRAGSEDPAPPQPREPEGARRERGLDMERARLLRELEKAESMVQSITGELDMLRESVARMNLEKAQTILQMEHQMKAQLEREKEKLRDNLALEKKQFQYDLMERERRFFAEYASFLQDWKV